MKTNYSDQQGLDRYATSAYAQFVTNIANVRNWVQRVYNCTSVAAA